MASGQSVVTKPVVILGVFVADDTVLSFADDKTATFELRENRFRIRELEPLAEAVEVVSELSGRERSSNSKLTLELLGETKFKGGDRKTVNIMVCRGTERKVISDAEIMVKVLGSSFRPVIFHARSDANGLAKVHLQLPNFDAGRAALLVRAIASGEEIELRRIVQPG